MNKGANKGIAAELQKFVERYEKFLDEYRETRSKDKYEALEKRNELIKDMETKLEKYVREDEFKLIRNIVFIACGTILLGFLGYLVASAWPT